MARFELLEWRDRRYQHLRFVRVSEMGAKVLVDSLNKGYTGPRFIIRPAQA